MDMSDACVCARVKWNILDKNWWNVTAPCDHSSRLISNSRNGNVKFCIHKHEHECVCVCLKFNLCKCKTCMKGGGGFVGKEVDGKWKNESFVQSTINDSLLPRLLLIFRFQSHIFSLSLNDNVVVGESQILLCYILNRKMCYLRENL